MADFDWDALKTFLAVARTGRLTAAAQRLGADHTTVSRRIAGLEAALKAALFHRAPTGYTLTAHGERLLPIAESMETLSLSAQGEVGEADLSLSGAVRIGAPEGFGSYFLAPRLGAFADAHPQLKVELVAIAGLFSLSKREADIAIHLSAPREGRLVARKLTEYRLGLYASPAYLASAPPLERRADLPAHRFIGYIEDLLQSPELDYLRQGEIPIDAQIKSSNLIAQLGAARAGAGLCVLPHFIAGADLRLMRVLPDQVSLERAFWLVIHADLKGLARVRETADFIVEQVAAQRRLFLGD
ncbi:MAG TPA: LysR family transcriptional regulator [Caulobacteraceae bacterium]|jgi:DNA-binding transcriptional LysR family regulator